MNKYFLNNKRFFLYVLFLLTFTSEMVFGQDVFLRLTDYAGGKTNLVIQSLDIQGTQAFIWKIKSIEIIIRYDLDYSLYFEVYSDTTVFVGDFKKSGVLLRISAIEPNLMVVLQDFKSKETIGELNLQFSGNLRSLAHQISDYVIEMLTGERGIASTKVVFSYRKKGKKALGLIDYDGYNFKQLTKNENYNHRNFS